MRKWDRWKGPIGMFLLGVFLVLFGSMVNDKGDHLSSIGVLAMAAAITVGIWRVRES